MIAWHRQGFRRYGSWKSCRAAPGRPDLANEIRELIRNMSRAHPLWGAPRIHGELLKLGRVLCQATVAKYRARTRKPPSQTGRTFLHNHASQRVSTDFFVVPTATFRLLYVFIVLAQERRRVIHFNVTAPPSSEWTARPNGEAFLWGRCSTLSAARSRFDLRRSLP